MFQSRCRSADDAQTMASAVPWLASSPAMWRGRGAVDSHPSLLAFLADKEEEIPSRDSEFACYDHGAGHESCGDSWPRVPVGSVPPAGDCLCCVRRAARIANLAH